MRIDLFDLKLLRAIQADGRLTSQELADRVGLSASQCARRRAALEKAGVIEGYHAELSGPALGLESVVFVEIALAAHSSERAHSLQALLQRLPEVQEAYSLTGANDYLVKLVVPNLKALSAVLNDRLLAHEGVAHLRSSIVLDRLKETRELPLAHLRADGRAE
jgi:DNA-binding Lrp family transcriptional regulator